MENGKSWTEQFRWITPVLITIAIALLGILLTTMNNIDEKLFKHLTNDELHCPRSLMVTRAEFNIYQVMRDKQMDDIRFGLGDIRRILEKNGR